MNENTAHNLLQWSKGLASQLSLADDEAFLRAVWAVNAIQQGDIGADQRFLRRVPPDLETGAMFAKRAIYPWELDTLANELLTTPKNPFYRSFNSRDWQALAQLANLLRNIENAEYGVRRSEISILAEMGRIAARQFDWQRGFFNIADLYRSTYIYGQGACADHLSGAFGISVEDLTFTGFALMAMYVEAPATSISADYDLLAQMGLSTANFRKVLPRIALPLPEVRQEAALLRSSSQQTAYRPSILRRYPCVLFGRKLDRMVAPVPQLIAYRLTSGLFFDVVGGGGAVRAECGKRFECYALALLSATIPDMRFEPEWRYKAEKGGRDSSDILHFDETGDVRVAIECKARRMNAEARLGENPLDAAGYDEIIKGVFQLWRFFSDCRRGFTGQKATMDAIGVVLALDEWFAARGATLERVVDQAHKMADASGPHILAEDRRPIAFCTISELEQVLRTATEESLLEALDLLATTKKGHIFSTLHSELDARKASYKPYPFKEELYALLPWYEQLKIATRDADDDDEF